jgi:hypothetical protein
VREHGHATSGSRGRGGPVNRYQPIASVDPASLGNTRLADTSSWRWQRWQTGPPAKRGRSNAPSSSGMHSKRPRTGLSAYLVMRV